MEGQLQCWETTVWVGLDLEQSVKLYGEDRDQLKAAVLTYLQDKRPDVLANQPKHSPLLKRTRNYYFINDNTRGLIRPFGRPERLPDGWHLSKGFYKWSEAIHLSPKASPEIYRQFIENDLIIEPGPDFKALEDISKGNTSLLRSYPYIRWAVFGLIASVCFLGIPVSGAEIHFILQRGALFAIGYIVLTTIIFTFVGPAATRFLRQRGLLPEFDDIY